MLKPEICLIESYRVRAQPQSKAKRPRALINQCLTIWMYRVRACNLWCIYPVILQGLFGCGNFWIIVLTNIQITTRHA